MNQNLSSIGQCEDDTFFFYQEETSKNSQCHVVKEDSFKIFADEKWEDFTPEICSRQRVDYFSRFDQISLHEKISNEPG